MLQDNPSAPPTDETTPDANDIGQDGAGSLSNSEHREDAGGEEGGGSEGAGGGLSAEQLAEYREAFSRTFGSGNAAQQPERRQAQRPSYEDEQDEPRQRDDRRRDDEDDAPRRRQGSDATDWGQLSRIIDEPATNLIRDKFQTLERKLEKANKVIERLSGLMDLEPGIRHVVARNAEDFLDEVHGGLDELAGQGFADLFGKDRATRESNAQAYERLVSDLVRGANVIRDIAKRKGERITLKESIKRACLAVTGQVPKAAALNKLEAGVKAAARTGGVPGRTSSTKTTPPSSGYIPRDAMIQKIGRQLRELGNDGG